MMRIELIFAQTQYDQGNMWREHRKVEVEVPDWIAEKYAGEFEWHLEGMLPINERSEQ